MTGSEGETYKDTKVIYQVQVNAIVPFLSGWRSKKKCPRLNGRWGWIIELQTSRSGYGTKLQLVSLHPSVSLGTGTILLRGRGRVVTPLWTSMPSREEQNSSNLLHPTEIGETGKISGPLGQWFECRFALLPLPWTEQETKTGRLHCALTKLMLGRPRFMASQSGLPVVPQGEMRSIARVDWIQSHVKWPTSDCSALPQRSCQFCDENDNYWFVFLANDGIRDGAPV